MDFSKFLVLFRVFERLAKIGFSKSSVNGQLCHGAGAFGNRSWLATACQGSWCRQFHRKGKGKEGNYTYNTLKSKYNKVCNKYNIIWIITLILTFEKYNMVTNLYNMVHNKYNTLIPFLSLPFPMKFLPWHAVQSYVFRGFDDNHIHDPMLHLDFVFPLDWSI